jgi:hypothetical protein
MSEINGIFQPDVIIRTALLAGIKDIRANPWLLNYVFNSLPQDALTTGEYGASAVEEAKKWFLDNDVKVSLDVRLDQAVTPCVTIGLMSHDEVENTIGDVHYEPVEEAGSDWPVLAGPFSPTAYSQATGIMSLPASVTELVSLSTQMVIVDARGNSYPITEVFDDGSISIQQNTVADFSNAVVKAAKTPMLVAIESASFRDTYQIGCHAAGEPIYAIYLQSIVEFILLRYRESFLEARGFERSAVAAGDFHKRDDLSEPESFFSRYITLTGYVRNSWPKGRGYRMLSSSGTVQIIDGQHVPVDDPTTQNWVGDLDNVDSLGFK